MLVGDVRSLRGLVAAIRSSTLRQRGRTADNRSKLGVGKAEDFVTGFVTASGVVTLS